ncbi:HIRAN domain-containing protein [Agromyces ramosus]|uniref:HIRAN domain-containing protein n=1 Tax=Agromyces ramosus TaxID=33879 RepID=A0ABU0RDJ2_9MICO|nr:HIRAN domain-containing protein [Agromyces ramosus]MDQ0895792.1 hypothetical protein [Agromyces ramosus]
MPYRGELWLSETTTGKLIPVGNRHLARLGLWAFRVRGVQYRPEAAKAADLNLGKVVRLEREPNNEHDRNAIAVVGTAGKLGYVNKQMAARLAKLIDGGEQFKAIVVGGAPAGEQSSRVQVIAADPALIAHLQGVKSTSVRISSPDGDFVEIRLDGYQFGASDAAPTGGWDENWLLVDGRVKLAEESWEFRDPCLTTWEARELLAWLRAVPPAVDTSIEFTEPNLSLAAVAADPGESILVIRLAGEAAPPSASWDDRWGRGIRMELRVEHALLAVATNEWEQQLQLYPLR